MYAGVVKGVPTTAGAGKDNDKEGGEEEGGEEKEEGEENKEPTGAGQYYPHCAIKVLDLGESVERGDNFSSRMLF